MVYLKQVLLLLITFVLFTADVAAEIELKIQLSEKTLILGDEITLQLKINGTNNNVELMLPTADGLLLKQRGAPRSSSQTTIINGKVTSFQGLIYHIGITAQKTGTFTVPGIKIKHRNKVYQAEGFRVRVKKPDQQTKMKIITEVSSTQIYLQESLKVTLKWYLQDDVEDYHFRFPLLDIKDKISLSLVESGGSGVATNLTVSGYKVPFVQGNEMLGGETFSVYKVVFQVIPDESGSFTVPVANIKAKIKHGTELRRDFFGRQIRSPKLKSIFASSKPIVVTIKPLPEKNKPSDFTGGVGSFNIRISTDASKVKVGDPIEISIKIDGEGRLDKIEQPILTEVEEFKRNFAIVDSLQPGDLQEGSIVFKQIIRPQHEKVKRIPPVSFSFFNTEAGKYKTIKSNPIPIKVLSVRRVTDDDIIVNRNNGTRPGRAYVKKQRGIYANYTFEDVLVSQQQQGAWILMLVLPPFGYLFCLILVSRYRKLSNDESLARVKSARGVKNRRLKKAKSLIGNEGDVFFGELSKALRGYISDKLNLGDGVLTATGVRELGESTSIMQELIEPIAECLEEFDRLRFTSQQSSNQERQEMFDKVNHLIKRLEKSI